MSFLLANPCLSLYSTEFSNISCVFCLVFALKMPMMLIAEGSTISLLVVANPKDTTFDELDSLNAESKWEIGNFTSKGCSPKEHKANWHCYCMKADKKYPGTLTRVMLTRGISFSVRNSPQATFFFVLEVWYQCRYREDHLCSWYDD